MPHQSTEHTVQVSTTPVAPSTELPAGVADLDQAREKRKRRKVQKVPANTGHGLSRYAYLDAIMGDRNLTQAERQILTALWKRTQDEGALYAWPSAATLAADVGLKWERDARRHLANLRAKGYLEDMGPGTWAHLVPRVGPGRDVTTLHILALPRAAAEDTPEAGGMGTAPRGGMGTAPRGGVGTAPIQTTKGTNHSTTKENPAAATAPPPAVSEVVEKSKSTDDSTPWKSTILGAWENWARAVGDAEAEEETLEQLWALIARRNGPEAADWARDYWGWHDSRALAIATAPSRNAARYEAGAQYSEMLHAAAADPRHYVTVENMPATGSREPVAVVDRDDAESIAAEAEQLRAAGQLAPEIAAWLNAQQNPEPLGLDLARVLAAQDDDAAAAEADHQQQAAEALAARVAQQEVENRRRQDRARLDARYQAEAQRPSASAELEDLDTVSPQDWAEAVALFAAVPSSPDDFAAPAAVPELEDLTEPTPEDRAEFVRLFLVPDADNDPLTSCQDPTTGTPWDVPQMTA